MSAIPVQISDRLRADLAAARRARRSGDHLGGWQRLEDAHVLGQPWARWHVRVHGSMLAAGVRSRDLREVWGQLVRLAVAGPGSATGRYPVGNTGRASVAATRPVPIREDLLELLRAAGR
jgi:hypothetical protein